MNKLIQEIFEQLNIKCFYLTRVNEEEEYVVFSHIQTFGTFSDNQMENTQYTILINFYCKNNIEEKKNKILKAMLGRGFKLMQVQATLIEKNGVYNTPFKFKKMEGLNNG